MRVSRCSLIVDKVSIHYIFACVKQKLAFFTHFFTFFLRRKKSAFFREKCIFFLTSSKISEWYNQVNSYLLFVEMNACIFTDHLFFEVDKSSRRCDYDEVIFLYAGNKNVTKSYK